MSWLLDTCALSEYTKKTPAQKVITWLDEQDETSLFLSVITIGEIEKGILKLRATDLHRSQKLTAWLGKLEQRFSGRILPLDAAALHVWAQISAHTELAGQPLPVMDSLLMATAQCHGHTIVTRNVQDFAPYPQIFNPWEL
jgi:predicted nucleic acid-binding protein